MEGASIPNLRIFISIYNKQQLNENISSLKVLISIVTSFDSRYLECSIADTDDDDDELLLCYG